MTNLVAGLISAILAPISQNFSFKIGGFIIYSILNIDAQRQRLTCSSASGREILAGFVRKEDLILPYKLLLAVMSINIWFTCLAPPESEAGRAIPINLFNIGNSIGEGEAADGIIGVKQHDVVWSTGYNLNDIVVSLNERFEAADPAGYFENNAARDTDFNQAVSGSEFDIQFGEIHVNDGDCFHPSTAGHALLADEQWCRSPWGRFDPSCGRLKPTPWIPLLLLNN